MTFTNSMFKILIVDDEPEYRKVIGIILKDQNYYTDTAANASEALEKLKKESFDLVLTDLIMGSVDGIQLLEKIRKDYSDIEVIIITGYGTIKNAVEAIKKGAFSYFIKEHDPEELLMEIKKVYRFSALKNENTLLRAQHTNNKYLLATKNCDFQNIISIAEKAAESNANILILGESGVGKEILAKHIFNCSSIKKDHFIAVNCHAYAENIIESELFGHERGAFTGAVKKRKGKFEIANNGTLFLDEIGDLTLSTQIKLLRALETRKIERVGSNLLIDIDFKLICATNANLKDSIKTGTFRKDLYYRISTITIEIPPLRDRREDLPELIDFFFKLNEVELKKKITRIDKKVEDFLNSHDYPGNIRELKNIIERLVVLSEKGVIREKDLPNFSSKEIDQSKKPIALKIFRKKMEIDYIKKVLTICGNNVSETARKLDISPRQLFNKINEYGLRK